MLHPDARSLLGGEERGDPAVRVVAAGQRLRAAKQAEAPLTTHAWAEWALAGGINASILEMAKTYTLRTRGARCGPRVCAVCGLRRETASSLFSSYKNSALNLSLKLYYYLNITSAADIRNHAHASQKLTHRDRDSGTLRSRYS